jgi:triacylglycerol lipase
MYFPQTFVLGDAVECGELIDQAYSQYVMALQAGKSNWLIQGDYTLNGSFFAVEDAKALPFGFVASKNGIFYVVIRGTQAPLEWFNDASIDPTPFRSGWGNTTKGLLGIHEQIFPTIRNIIAEERASVNKLFVAGHGLGGALAMLAAADLIFSEVAPAKPTLYTFSCPRAGDSTFATKFKEERLAAWRIFNTEDIVPTLPLSALYADPRSIGLFESKLESLLKLVFKENIVFQHVGEPIAVTFQRNTISDNHNLTYLYQFLAMQTLT